MCSSISPEAKSTKEEATGMLSERAVQPAVSVNANPFVDFVSHTLTVVEAEARKLRHDPWELLTRAVQPMLWLLVFGQVFGRIRGVPTGAISYRDFLAPGVLAQSGLFIAIFYGITAVWERDLGIVHKYLVSPASRVALVLGKALSAGLRGLSQGLIIYILSVFLGVDLRFSPGAILGVLARSEEHTSELQSPCNLVCRLLLEKKKHRLHTV